ncbi:MAG: hypothetical protein IPK19_26530 [Chloroflexi bacterium]|nr:hypothetical protein [Chloroflexota bacterium]
MPMRRHILKLMLVLLCAALGLTYAPALTAQSSPYEVQVFDARADLEVLADQVLGIGIRPPTWSGNTDVQSPSVVTDLWYDNEQLANAIFGPESRPAEWIGVTVPINEIIARNVRHDLELAADAEFGIGQRPEQWRGAVPILRCSRYLQNTLTVLDRFYNVRPSTPDSALNYCFSIQSEIEDELINIVFGTQDASGNLPNPFDLLSAVRGDLERLADERLGLQTRPEGWNGERDANAPNFTGNLRVDIERLADDQLGVGNRPGGYIGLNAGNPASTYLNLRFDLELMADVLLGIDTRPTGWQGVNAIERCAPLTRSLAFIVQDAFDFSIAEFDPTSATFCTDVGNAVSSLVENPPVLDVAAEEILYTAESRYAFAYLDVAATDYMGIMPAGIQFRALYRNYNESSMMFVQGDNFAVYLDRRFTSLAETTFRGLPTLNDIDPLAFCDAYWCNGPGPTPTPTGSGPLMSILVQTTPVAAPNQGDVAATKQQVSWNYVRVTYVFDNLQARTAQVTLELCPEAARPEINCEPVLQVFDNNTNTQKQVISQFNGLNVYEFAYGYSTNVLIESETLFSQDVWISDPTIR